MNSISIKKTQGQKRIIIIDQDPFSRNWISQLFMKDWRTQVIFETNSIKRLHLAVQTIEYKNVDGIVLNLDHINLELDQLEEILSTISSTPKILLVSTEINKDFDMVPAMSNLGGYVIKSDIEISIVWAMIKAIQGYFVVSKRLEKYFHHLNKTKLGDILVLDGVEASEYLTTSENRNARLALLFSMSRGNIADELMITEKSSWTLVSNLYKSMGVTDLLVGEDWIDFNIHEEPLIYAHMIRQGGTTQELSCAATKETFAYHVYTKPRMHKIGCE